MLLAYCFRIVHDRTSSNLFKLDRNTSEVIAISTLIEFFFLCFVTCFASFTKFMLSFKVGIAVDVISHFIAFNKTSGENKLKVNA